jgi:hypothetical protein
MPLEMIQPTLQQLQQQTFGHVPCTLTYLLHRVFILSKSVVLCNATFVLRVLLHVSVSMRLDDEIIRPKAPPSSKRQSMRQHGSSPK